MNRPVIDRGRVSEELYELRTIRRLSVLKRLQITCLLFFEKVWFSSIVEVLLPKNMFVDYTHEPPAALF